MEIENYIVAADNRLVELALSGDVTAFEHLFGRYRDSLRKLYEQRLGGGQDADDLLQETFIKVFIGMPRYDSRYTFGQWIYTIARNTFIDYVRKRKENISIDSLPTVDALISSGAVPSPEEKVIDRQRRDRLERYLGMLPDRYRRLVELRFFREYSYEEIAAELSLPLGTVKTQIHRARARLCAYMAEDGIV